MKGLGREHTRAKVRERDGWTCKDCGLVRTIQQVRDHNDRFGSGVKKGKIKSLDVHHLNGLCGLKSRKYDRVSDMHELITLCHKCHYNRHDHRKVVDGTYLAKRGDKESQVVELFQRGEPIKYIRWKFFMSEKRIKSILEANMIQ